MGITFIEDHLGLDTIDKAAGTDAVCVFVNDDSMKGGGGKGQRYKYCSLPRPFSRAQSVLLSLSASTRWG